MRRALGQATRYVEQKQVCPVTFEAICPGGVVRIRLPVNPDRTQIDVPDRILVVMTPDASKAAAGVQATPESVLGQGGFTATVQVPSEGGVLTGVVPGIKPGTGYDVQLIHEWDEGPAAPAGATKMKLVAQDEKVF